MYIAEKAPADRRFSVTPAAAVKLLLLTMNDYLPPERISTGLLASAPGPQASRYVSCDTCNGTGRLIGADQPCARCATTIANGGKNRRPRHGCRLCLACDGRGDRLRRAREDERDAYTGLPMSEAGPAISEAQKGPQRRNASERKETGDEIGWLRERQRYHAAGSYRELEQQLEWLRDRHHIRYERLMHWTSSQDDPLWHWPPEVLAAVDDTILMLARRMPGTVKVPRWVKRTAA